MHRGFKIIISLTVCWHDETLQSAIVMRVDSVADDIRRQAEFVKVGLTVEK